MYDWSEVQKDLQTYSKRMPATRKSQLNWVLNEMQRIKNGKFNYDEIIAFTQHICNTVSELESEVSYLRDKIEGTSW